MKEEDEKVWNGYPQGGNKHFMIFIDIIDING